MIVGDRTGFAIESIITKAYSEVGLRALGLFAVHIRGCRFGVYDPEASLLANSFDAVQRRLASRGRHIARFSTNTGAEEIAKAVSFALYFECKGDRLLGYDEKELAEMVYSRELLWIPDGDEAFDDGSYVVQFDVEDQVRLIAFNRLGSDPYDPATLTDFWLSADNFYGTLGEWQDQFVKEWQGIPKQVP
jgi:hypothetical protein